MHALLNFIFGIVAACAVVNVHAAELSSADIAEIDQLYARYNQTLDSGNAEAWADTFTPDGVFNRTNIGREALIKFAKTFHEQGGGLRRHWNNNRVLNRTPEGIDGSVYLMLWDVGSRPATLILTGIYEDKLVKTADGWRFKSRLVKPDPLRAAAPTAVTK